MKKTNYYFTLLLLFLSATSLQAQNWITNYDQAKQEAQTNNKKIILVFSGSDWCAPCIKLEEKIWKSVQFKNYAKDHYIMLRADFPRRKKNKLPKEQQVANNMLAEKYNPNGYFPLVVILSPEGKVLGATGFDSKKTPQDYIDLFNSY